MSDQAQTIESRINFLGPARFYRGLGFSPIPIKMPDKVPKGIASFKQYFEQRPGDEELEKWFTGTDEDLGIAVLITDGFLAIDIDGKALWSLIFSKPPQDKANETWVHETPRGYRVFYKVPQGIITSKVTAAFPGDHRGVELKPAGAGYVVVPPTKGFERLSPSAFQDIKALDDTETKILLRTVQLFGKYAKIIDCVSREWSEGKRHLIAGPLAGFLRKEGLNKEETETIVESICRLAGDFEWGDRLKYIDDTYVKRISEIAGYSKLVEIIPDLREAFPPRGVEVGTQAQKVEGQKKIREINRSKFITREKVLYESVEDGFITKGPDGTLIHVPQIELSNEIIIPPGEDSIPYRPYQIPAVLEGKITNTYDDIFAILSDYWDHDEFYRHVASCFVILSYLQDKVKSVPFFYLYGDINSGKTRVLEILAHLSYRPLSGVSINYADIYSYFEAEQPGTIIEDEIQGIERDSEKLKIHKTGYRPGARVPRIRFDQFGRRVQEYYRNYGLRAFAAEKLPGDAARGFRDRLIEIQCVEAYPQYDELRAEDLERMQEIRNKLLAWRALNYDTLEMPECDLKLKGRMKELWKPLMQIASLVGGSCLEKMSVGLESILQNKMEMKRQTLEGRLVWVVLKAVEENHSLEIANDVLWSRLQTELDGIVDIERKPNSMETESFGRLYKNFIGKRLSEVMDAGDKVSNSKRFRCFKMTKLKLLARRYDYDFQPPLEK